MDKISTLLVMLCNLKDQDGKNINKVPEYGLHIAILLH